MNKCLFLLKDKSIKTIKKNFMKVLTRNYNIIEYILFPIDDNATAYILHEPENYMLNFHRAVISYESVVVQFSYLDDVFGQNYTPMLKITKEVDSLIGLMQYLHSINRIVHTNKISDSNDCINNEVIDFIFFQLDIFDKDDNRIFHKKLSMDNQKGCFGPREILEKISDIYNPEIDLYKNNNNVSIMNDMWSIIPCNKIEYGICGIPMLYTSSIVFIPLDILKIFKSNVKSVYSYNIIYNKELVTEEEAMKEKEKLETPTEKIVNSIRFNDMWTPTINDWIEYIVYLRYAYINMASIIEINDFLYITGKYYVKSDIQVDTISHGCIGIDSNSDYVVDLNDIYQLLIEIQN